MGYMRLYLPDELDKEWRKWIAMTMGMYKGNISDAYQEAIKLWIEQKKANVDEETRLLVIQFERRQRKSES